MAGGRSQRMRSTLGPMHKGLVPIVGISLLERNICALAAHGIRRIVVAINERESGMRDYVQNRGRSVVGSVGGSIECFEESEPLGTIGAAGQLWKYNPSEIVVANVDNLTTLNWKEMLAYHRRKMAGMTVAAHWQTIHSSLGELTVGQGNVIQYQEKPVRKVLISSGSYVLDAATCHLIPPRQRTDAPDLVRQLLDDQRTVAAFQHESPWIDINDAETIADAERLVARHFSEFECWHPAPQAERLHLLACCDQQVLAERHVAREGPAGWGLPEAAVEGDLEASAVTLGRRFGLGTDRPRYLGAYDDLDERLGSVTRRHIFLLQVSERTPISVPDGYAWIRFDEYRNTTGPMARATELLKMLR